MSGTDVAIGIANGINVINGRDGAANVAGFINESGHCSEHYLYTQTLSMVKK